MATDQKILERANNGLNYAALMFSSGPLRSAASAMAAHILGLPCEKVFADSARDALLCRECFRQPPESP